MALARDTRRNLDLDTLGPTVTMLGARHIGKLTAGILVALAMFGSASPSVAEQLSAEPEVVEVTVGQHRYAIPNSYILAVRRDPKDDSVRRVMMQALWPGLEPFGMEIVNLRGKDMSTQEFISRHVTINLEATPRRSSRFLEGGSIQRHLREDGPFGLSKYTKGTRRTFVASEPAYVTPTGRPLVLTCDKLLENVKKHFKNAAPICRTSYPFAEGAEGVYYLYYFVNLAHWREIDGAIRSLFRSFQY
jgi:hypothetical protein